MSTPKTRQTLLVIDDDRIFCQAVKDHFSSDKLDVLLTHRGDDGLKICAQQKIDLVLLDQKLPDTLGNELCKPILQANEHTKIIFITAFPSYSHAVQAVKSGSYDYLSKPIDLDELELAITQAFNFVELEKVKQFNTYRINHEKKDIYLTGNFGGNKDISNLIDLAASVDSPVLITGETGTGKNIAAKVIHYKGLNPEAPFISINCAALPENLVETELYGYEKGAFTGAVSTRKGLFEIADGGTLFLDEIGTMPLQLQSKLLGALDEGKIRRVGGQSMIPVNVRIIVATNSNLEALIAAKSFREDLFYRLSVLRIHIPPLRERLDDIERFSHFFIRQSGKAKNVVLPDSEIANMMKYSWPGNIRELKNIIEHSIIIHKDILHPSELIKPTLHAQLSPKKTSPEPSTIENFKTLEMIEIDYIKSVLKAFSWNYSRTARTLGISLSTLKRKIKQYKIVSPNPGAIPQNE